MKWQPFRIVVTVFAALVFGGCAARSGSLAVPLLSSTQAAAHFSPEQCSSSATARDNDEFHQFLEANRFKVSPEMLDAYYRTHAPANGFGVQVVSGSYAVLPDGVRSYHGAVTLYLQCIKASGTVARMLVYPSGFVTFDLGHLPRTDGVQFSTQSTKSYELSTITVKPASP